MSESQATHGIVLIGREAWRLGVVTDGVVAVERLDFGDDATLADRVEAIRVRLSAAGWTDRPVVLALDSPHCLCATFDVSDLDRAGRRKAMAFRLEENLPLAAEDAVADFLELPDGRAVGVCSALADLKPLVDAYENAGIPVRHVCPTALLMTQQLTAQHTDLDAVLIASGDADRGTTDLDLLELHDHRPTHWWWFADDRTAAAERIALLTSQADRPAEAALLRIARLGSDADEPGASPRLEPVEPDVADPDHAAALQAVRILDGIDEPWINLRRDQLAAPDPFDTYRRPVLALAAAVVLLLVSTIVIGQWRTAQYAAAATDLRAEQAEVFRDAMPGQRVPFAGIRNRLESERRKLAGLGGRDTASGDDADALHRTSALTHLQHVLAALPTNVRFRLLDLSIEPDRIRVAGEAQSHADAERLVIALRQTGGYDVDPPETQALRDRGVSFSFAATPVANPPSEPQALQQQAESDPEAGDRT